MRDAARTIGAFLQATKTAYAETVSNYFSDALTTTRSRIALASAIMAIALSTGVRIVDAALVEEAPVLRVLSVWGAGLWLLGFGYSAALILKPVHQRPKR